MSSIGISEVEMKMKKIFVNLKRFDVPRSRGGICPFDNPRQWVEWVVAESVKIGRAHV